MDKRKQTLTPPFIAVFTPPFAIPLSLAAGKKGSLGRGRSGTSAQSFVLCFSVFRGDFLLQISQKFLSETAPPMQALSGKPLCEKPQNAAAEFFVFFGDVFGVVAGEKMECADKSGDTCSAALC